VTRVVLDTNVLAPGFATQNRVTAAAILIDLWSQQVFELVVSEHLLLELSNTLAGSHFSKLFTPAEVADLLANIKLRALFTDLTVSVTGIASHPEDDLILSTGLSAGASISELGIGSC
jgi:predicted nucleic acid-binding protein